MLSRRVLGGFIAVALVLAAGIPAAATDIPLKNWSAPPTWLAQASSGGGRTALALSQGFPVPFIPVTPCRVMDTRGNGQTGAFGVPQLGVNVTRTVPIPTHPTCTGVPTSATAYSLNIAVTNTGAGAFGFLQVWPTGAAQPTSANLNYPGAGATLSNAAVVAAGTSGAINVFSGNASADVIIDINGYYAFDVANSAGGFEAETSTNALYAVSGLNTTTDGVGILGTANVGTGAIGVRGISTGGMGVKGTSTSNVGVQGVSTGFIGVQGLSTSFNGLWGESTTQDGLFASGGNDGAFMQGLRFGASGVSLGTTGQLFGLIGQISSTTANNGAAGVRGTTATGTSLDGFSTNYAESGVQGVVGGSLDAYGVLGVAIGTSGWGGFFARQNPTTPFAFTSWAGFASTPTQAATFNGNVSIVGTLSKTAGTFKIDHPLDPENKYLYHSFVESPDMKNIYDGIVTLNEFGEATVDLPDYFEALNSDFRYQLTSIGRAQANLYIADEVQGLKFRIAGGKPHARVSWQVTGIRQDAYAKAHRVQVVEEKGRELRGTYLHPVEHGKPAERSEFSMRDGKPIMAGQRAPDEN